MVKIKSKKECLGTFSCFSTTVEFKTVQFMTNCLLESDIIETAIKEVGAI